MPKIRRFVAGALACTALPLGVLATTAPSAAAAPPGCASGALCVYVDTGYDGRKFQFFGDNKSWGAWAIEDEDSSWFNNGTSGMAVRVYDGRDYTGGGKCFRRGTGEDDAVLVDDRGSSNEWLWRC